MQCRRAMHCARLPDASVDGGGDGRTDCVVTLVHLPGVGVDK